MSESRPEYLKDALEMMGLDLDKPKEIIQEVSGFTPLFDAVIEHYKDETRAAVHGVMWRFCQMQDGVCKASLTTIAEWIGVSVATVSRHAEELVKDGYFIDLTPDLRNKPHVYADTGRVVMKSKISASVAQSKATVAQSKASVAESRMTKDLNKDSTKELGVPPTYAVEWQIAGQNQTVIIPDEFDAKAKDAASLIATGMGVMAEDGYWMALAFMRTRKIAFTESQIKGQRKAIKALIEAKVLPVHIKEAVEKLINDGMTVTDLYSVTKTAISLANPTPETTGYNPQGLSVS